MAYKVSLGATARDCGGGEGSLQVCGTHSLTPQHPEALFLALLLIESGSLDSGAEIFFRVSSINDIFKATFCGVSFLSSLNL